MKHPAVATAVQWDPAYVVGDVQITSAVRAALWGLVCRLVPLCANGCRHGADSAVLCRGGARPAPGARNKSRIVRLGTGKCQIVPDGARACHVVPFGAA